MNRKHIIRNLRLKGIPFDENLSTKELDNLLNGPDAQNRVCKKFNFAGGGGKISVAFNSAKADEPAQIMICEDIGKDAWSGEGISVTDVQNALDAITPKTRPLNFLVDSPGGSVNVGSAIHNILLGWPGVINKTIIGVAASTASWMIPADKTFAYKNSQIFMHRAMCGSYGNEDDHQVAIDFIKKTNGQITEMYADQSGGEPDEMFDLMKGPDGQGTLLTGAEAKAIGMVDELIDGEATNQFSADWLNSARKKLSALNSLSALPTQGERNKNNNQNHNTMNKEQKIALLNKRGITVPADADDAKLDSLITGSNHARNSNIDILNSWGVKFNLAATDEEIKNLVMAGKPATNAAPQLDADTRALIEGFKNQAANSRRKEIREAVNKGASEGRILATEVENWENDAFAAVDDPKNGNPVLNRLNKLEAKTPGVPAIPEATNRLEVGSDIKDLCKGFESFNQVTASWKRGNDVSMREIANASKARALFTKKHRNQMFEAVNANTVPAGLQQQFIMQDVVIRDFARRVVQLGMFGTVFRNVPLLGKDTVEVPYFDLDATASQAYAGSYDNLVSNSVGDVREITVGWGPAKDGAIGKGYARLVQALSFTSQEFARQPYLNIAQRAALKAEKLAFDIFQDVLSVVKVANFPTLLTAGNKITKSFDQFSSDDLADLKVACKAWPMGIRGLLLDSAYDGNLMKDPTFKAAYQQAFDSVKTLGKLNPELYGFGYTENPNIPDNGINLRGLAFVKYAILVAFAPVPPVEEVRRAGTNYEVYTDADSDVTLEYRSYGSNSADAATYVIESNYGYVPGLKTGIKPIVTP